MDLETLLKYSGMEKDISESRMSDLDIEAQDNSREDFVDMHKDTFGSAEEAGKFWDDSKEANESVETEAVGIAADPIMDLCDDVGCDPDHPIFQELVRYLDVDQIADFVADYRRNHDMPNGMDEASEVEVQEEKATWPKSDDDESAPQVGDTVMHDKHGLCKVEKISDTDMNGEPAEYMVKCKDGMIKLSYDQLVMGESVEEGMKSKTFPTVFNDEDVMVANDPDSALELIADEISTQDVDMYMDAIRKGDYESLLDALDGFGYKMKYEEADVQEADVQETVEVAVDDLASLMSLAGLQADTQATEALDEYSNSPDEDYMDADMQLNKLSGGLNGPKAHTRKEGPGDNPLAAKLADQLQALMSK